MSVRFLAVFVALIAIGNSPQGLRAQEAVADAVAPSSPESSSSSEGEASSVTDPELEAIRSASARYVEAYNGRDAAGLAALWSDQAVYVVPDTGEELKGREAIREMFESLFVPDYAAKLSVEVESIRMITREVASETGLASVVDGEGISTSRYTAIYVKQGDQWLLDSIHDTEIAVPVAEPNPLSELEWMVGEWVDQAEQSTVETTVKWTANRKFMTRNFRVTVAGEEILAGAQVIGWDPIQQQIRSWVFDSDGGLSNGSWKRKGENWVVESTGYLADGSTASSIQVYEKLDDNTFTWQSFGREVAGERLPDIAPVRVVRK